MNNCAGRLGVVELANELANRWTFKETFCGRDVGEIEKSPLIEGIRLSDYETQLLQKNVYGFGMYALTLELRAKTLLHLAYRDAKRCGPLNIQRPM